jgi:hypothetical protein
MAARYDQAADAILSGAGVLFPRERDPHDTGQLARPPGYPLFLALCYELLGRDFFRVGLVQTLVEGLTTAVLFLLASRTLGPWVGVASGVLYAVGHYAAYYANLVTPDTLCVLPILLALLILAPPRPRRAPSWARFATAGAILGASCWLRPNTLVLGPALAVACLALYGRPGALVRAGTVLLASLLVVGPITLRNYLVYGRLVPVSINMGIVLWEGIADAGGEAFGAKGRDYEVAWQEAQEFQEARYAEWWASPDGILRDRARIRKSLKVIRAHPAFFAKAALGRLGTMVLYRYDEPPRLAREAKGEAPPQSANLALGELLAPLRPAIRAAQGAIAASMVPLYLGGVVLVGALSPRRALFLFFLPAVVLLVQSPMHLEFRVTLPMHALLLVFAGATLALGAGAGAEALRSAASRTPGGRG